MAKHLASVGFAFSQYHFSSDISAFLLKITDMMCAGDWRSFSHPSNLAIHGLNSPVFGMETNYRRKFETEKHLAAGGNHSLYIQSQSQSQREERARYGPNEHSTMPENWSE